MQWIWSQISTGLGGRAHLFGAPLDATVLARHVLAVPVVSGPACEAQVRVTLSDSQVAWALLGVALSFTAAARKAVLTYRDVGEMVAVRTVQDWPIVPASPKTAS